MVNTYLSLHIVICVCIPCLSRNTVTKVRKFARYKDMEGRKYMLQFKRATEKSIYEQGMEVETGESQRR